MRTSTLVSVVVASVLLLYSTSAFGQGVMLRAVGAVNESMGSTATACPLDAAGAINWNPASISALEKNEMSFGLGIIMPKSVVSSSMEHPDLGPISGSTEGRTGAIPAPTMALVWRPSPKSRLTYGLGMGAVGGAATLYPADDPNKPINERNPVLEGISKSSTVVILQVTPTVSYKVSDRLSVGFAPIVDIAGLTLNPMQLGQGQHHQVHNYGTRYAWGAGFQMGAYYDFKNHFKTGFMFKSPVWAESLRYHGTFVNDGTPANGAFNLNLPMTLSAGISYDGFRNTVLALDIRYFDYANTNGFRTGLSPTGVVEGLDWNSIVSVAMGVERTLSKKLKVRMGYCFNENPVPSRSAFLNVSAPLTIMHALSFGATYAITKDFEANVAYSHGFKARAAGMTPDAVTYVSNESRANLLLAGFTKRW